MIQDSVRRWGMLDILVNNAGTTHRNRPLTEVSEEEYERIFAVNVKSVFLGARHVVPLMKEQGHGIILNVASTAGVRPRPGLVWYNTSKGAMMTATKAMAIELAPEKIRVNAINPVAGETGMLHLFMGEDTPPCLAAADSTGNRALDLSDSVFLLNYLFIGGDAPPAPFPGCGALEMAEDDLPCESADSCGA